MNSYVIACIIVALISGVMLGKKVSEYSRSYNKGWRCRPKAWQVLLSLTIALYFCGDAIVSVTGRVSDVLDRFIAAVRGEAPPASVNHEEELIRLKRKSADDVKARSLAEWMRHQAERAAQAEREAREAERAARRRAEAEAMAKEDERREAERKRSAAEKAVEAQKAARERAERRADNEAAARRAAEAGWLGSRDALNGVCSGKVPAAPSRKRRRVLPAPGKSLTEIFGGVIEEGDQAPAEYRADNNEPGWNELPLRAVPSPAAAPPLVGIPRGASGLEPAGEQRRVWEQRCGGYVVWWKVSYGTDVGWVNANFVCLVDAAGKCGPLVPPSRNPCRQRIGVPHPFGD